jgi:RNA polymerase sigma factor (sigma-70 family)
MRQIHDPNLAELLMQSKYTPPKKRRAQLEAIESLVALIEPDKVYPFEFIHFRITGFQLKRSMQSYTIPGDRLLDDLRIFITKLSTKTSIPVEALESKVYTIEELARSLQVSTKTINRWRKRGLAARRFVFPDGVKRLGVLESSLDTFQQKHPELLNQAKQFNRVTQSQKDQIVALARDLAKGDVSRHQVIEQVAQKTGRAHETIRYTLLQYDEAHPKTPIFQNELGLMPPEQAGRLYEAYQQGASVSELMERFNRSRSSIYRIINQRRAISLMARKIQFVHSEEFTQSMEVQKILNEPVQHETVLNDKAFESFEVLGEPVLPEYLEVVKGTPVLSHEKELKLFRRYNCLKYLAYTTRTKIKLSHVSSALLKLAEDYLAQADEVERMIVEANLRLVVSIANRHSTGTANFAEMVSKGNYALIKSVQAFDYTQGFRFGKWASLAIAKEYARVSGKSTELTRTRAASIGTIQQRLREAADIGAIERARHSLTQVIRSELDEREQHIILNHFGLIGHGVRKQKMTLKQIGDHLQLSKERVRQIELTALQKLRQCLSSEEFELLTG